jgi:hypothetical protein
VGARRGRIARRSRRETALIVFTGPGLAGPVSDSAFAPVTPEAAGSSPVYPANIP